MKQKTKEAIHKLVGEIETNDTRKHANNEKKYKTRDLNIIESINLKLVILILYDEEIYLKL